MTTPARCIGSAMPPTSEVVICACCHRSVQPGEYVVAPSGSRYAGRVICAACLDMLFRWPVGPSEYKADSCDWY